MTSRNAIIAITVPEPVVPNARNGESNHISEWQATRHTLVCSSDDGFLAVRNHALILTRRRRKVNAVDQIIRIK